MESLIEAIPFELEWGKFVLWVGMLSILLMLIKPVNMIAQGTTSLIIMIAKVGGRGKGERLRVGGKIGFDIEKAYLDVAITVAVMFPIILVVLTKTGSCFPIRIPFG